MHRSTLNRITRASLLAGALAASWETALADTPPDYGYQWATIGSLGNRPANENEAMFPMGSVGYTYRMSTTEIPVRQWCEFVQAYAPFKAGNPNESAFTSIWIGRDASGTYTYDPARKDFPVDVSWEYAARYCNWLQNGKASQAQAFEKGVYDASTFTFNANGSANHNYTHAPDARYWIPTFDAWIKGTYYDPAKSGSGQDGYWAYPNSSDSPPTPDLPGTPGATTNAGIPLSEDALSVGSYPDAKSPWGLLDTSGGLREWTSSDDQTVARRVMVQGSTAGDSLYTFTDYLGSAGLFSTAPVTTYGIRLASTAPAPGVGIVLSIFAFYNARRKRICQ